MSASPTPYQGFGYYTGLVSALTGQLKGEAEADRIRRQQEQLAQQNLMKALQVQQEQEMDAARLDLDERKLQEAVLGRKAKAAGGGLTPYQQVQEERRQAQDAVRLGDFEDTLKTVEGITPETTEETVSGGGWFDGPEVTRQVEQNITFSLNGKDVSMPKGQAVGMLRRRIDEFKKLGGLQGIPFEQAKELRNEFVRTRDPGTPRSVARKDAQILVPFPERVSEGGTLPAKGGAPAMSVAASPLTPEQQAQLEMMGAVARHRIGGRPAQVDDADLQPGEAAVSPSALDLGARMARDPRVSQASAGVKAEIVRKLMSQPDGEENLYRLRALQNLKALRERSR